MADDFEIDQVALDDDEPEEKLDPNRIEPILSCPPPLTSAELEAKYANITHATIAAEEGPLFDDGEAGVFSVMMDPVTRQMKVYKVSGGPDEHS